MERWIEKKVVHRGRIITLETGQVELDDGTVAEREVVQHPGAVGVVPCLGDSVVLVRQYRIAVEQEVLEIPAGKIEGDESPEHRGRVELEEETGYVAGRMVSAGFFYPSVGILNEKVHLYLAFDLTKTQQRLEEDERIEVVELSLDEAREGLESGAFVDAKTIIGLRALIAYYEANAP